MIFIGQSFFQGFFSLFYQRFRLVQRLFHNLHNFRVFGQLVLNIKNKGQSCFSDGLGFMWIFGGVTVLLMFIAFYVYNKWV